MNKPLGLSLLIVLIFLAPGCSQQKQVVSSTQAADDEVTILMPIEDVPPFTVVVNVRQFTLVKWKKARLREDVQETITDFESIKGRGTRHYKLRANEPVYKNDFVVHDYTDDSKFHNYGDVFHVVSLPTEKYATSFFKPGSRISCSVSIKPANNTEPAKTFFFLEDIEVKTVDETVHQPANTKDKPVIRLLLRLTMAQSLVLKYYSDNAQVDYVKRAKDDPTRVPFVFSLTPDVGFTRNDFVNSPEQTILDRWLGYWQITVKQASQQAKALTAHCTAGRVRYSQFIQDTAYYSDHTSMQVMLTYDKQQNGYRRWCFPSTGQPMEYKGTWDDQLKTMTWISINTPSAMTTCTQRFVDNDTINWTEETKDSSGQLLSRREGKTVRKMIIKEP